MHDLFGAPLALILYKTLWLLLVGSWTLNASGMRGLVLYCPASFYTSSNFEHLSRMLVLLAAVGKLAQVSEVSRALPLSLKTLFILDQTAIETRRVQAHTSARQPTNEAQIPSNIENIEPIQKHHQSKSPSNGTCIFALSASEGLSKAWQESAKGMTFKARAVSGGSSCANPNMTGCQPSVCGAPGRCSTHRLALQT